MYILSPSSYRVLTSSRKAITKGVAIVYRLHQRLGMLCGIRYGGDLVDSWVRYGKMCEDARGRG